MAWLIEEEYKLPEVPDPTDKKAMKAWKAATKDIASAKEANMDLRITKKTFKYEYVEVQEKKCLDIKALQGFCGNFASKTWSNGRMFHPSLRAQTSQKGLLSGFQVQMFKFGRLQQYKLFSVLLMSSYLCPLPEPHLQSPVQQRIEDFRASESRVSRVES